MLGVELFVVVALVVINGLLAMSELAVVSARPARLKAMADAGKRGAQAALDLAAEPGRFLSSVQIGITLVGVVAGAFSGATLASRFALWLQGFGLTERTAEPIAFAVVVGAITYLSLIVGELVPKQIALRNPERVAAMVAPAMRMVAAVAAPLVWLLSGSQALVLRLLGLAGDRESGVTDEEIRSLVAEAESAGVLEPQERQMIAGIMRFADRNVRGLMTPRRDVYWIDVREPADRIRSTILESPHSRLPVMDGEDENVLGVVAIKDVLDTLLSKRTLDIRKLIQPVSSVLDTVGALVVLERLKESSVPMVIVHDEYGHFEGIVTPSDILEAIAGTFRSEATEEPDAIKRADGSYLLNGSMPADEMADLLGIRLPAERDYHTLAGFILSVAKALPQAGETFDAGGWRFEVVDLDGSRIDKIIASRVTRPVRRAGA